MASMELKDFIARTLAQIIEGVHEAQRLGTPRGANVNPTHVSVQRQGVWDVTPGAPMQEVQFDVVLTESEGKGTEGGIGVFLGTLGLGSKGKTETELISVTRIRFSVPLVLPPGQKATPWNA